ncbi:class B sortase [Peptoniphilus grossensis]|uniref:class B sortase n=1 Tax=Peptoniphilus grossensis TaxID=1465756 RepID=UPI0002E295AA|nr:class B sortase [Peptoniphilus grossensis]MDU7150685.1 class B sortase [Peptoniphilus grossensis]
MKNKILSIVEIILIVILATSFYRIYSYNKADKEFKTATREVQEKFQKSNEEKLADDNRDKEAREKIEALQKDYESVIGWIKVDGTEIDYPIVKGSDNKYYLNHNYKNDYNVFGAIFMDYRNEENFSDQNTIIYGHNNDRGGNFRALHKLEEDGFFEKNRFIEIFSEAGYKKYQIFAVYKAGPYDEFRSPKYSEEDGEKLRTYIKERNILKTEVPSEFKDILTLQTCSPKDTRLVVQGKLVE